MNYYKKSTVILGWLVFAISTIVYLLTLEPSASLWDCGEFIATSYKMQIGHPPGAPLFMMINRLFTIFALDTSKVALMVNAASAVASGLTIAFLFWTIAHLSRRLIGETIETISKPQTWGVMGAALVGSLAYAFTDTFWFSAVEGEVYAQSSLFTAMVFWAILKWEDVADQPHANRWLVLVAYLMGLSIGVHLLNLLTIPAIGLVYYYRLHDNRDKKSWWKAFGVSVVILAVALYVIIPKSVEIGAFVDRIFVNTFSLPVNSGLAFFSLVLLGGLIYGAWRTYKKGKVLLNTILLCVTMMVFGYGSYATVVIRAAAETPMNSNQPDDPYALLSMLNREQYERQPLFKGQTFASPVLDDYKVSYTYVYNDDTKRYDKQKVESSEYAEEGLVYFPRMYSSSHADSYRNWADIKGKRVKINNKMVTLPTFGENLQYFFNYQFSFMYWRYFMWNFVGRQNDIQSQGEMVNGNWMSGIKPIDEIYLGPQDNLPADYANNSARNTYFFLPFILGLIGIMYQLQKDRNNFTVVMWLFIMTGIAIILYLNQPPMQPRERDYVFAGSFYAFSIWIGLGVLWVREMLASKAKLDASKSAVVATVVCMSVPTILIAENWDDHDRSHRYFMRDMGQNYLNSTLPNTILLPYGDNDTFPLWYNQEVEDVRRDVRVMNLSYLDSDWYASQMRNKTYESEPVEFTLPKSYYSTNTYAYVADLMGEMTIGEVLDFLKNDSDTKRMFKERYGTDMIIPTKTIKVPVNKANAIKSGIIKAEDADKALDTITLKLGGNVVMRGKIALLDAIHTSDWNRPFSFTQPFAIRELGLDKYLQLEGVTFRFVPFESTAEALNYGRIDSDDLYSKIMSEFKFGNIKDPRVLIDYFTAYTVNSMQMRNIAGRLASQLIDEGETAKAIEVLDKVMEEMPISQVNHNYNSYPLIDAYYKAGEKEKADQLLTDFTKMSLEYLNYFMQFDEQDINRIGSELNDQLMYLQRNYLLAVEHDRQDLAEQIKPYIDMLK